MMKLYEPFLGSVFCAMVLMADLNTSTSLSLK